MTGAERVPQHVARQHAEAGRLCQLFLVLAHRPEQIRRDDGYGSQAGEVEPYGVFDGLADLDRIGGWGVLVDLFALICHRLVGHRLFARCSMGASRVLPLVIHGGQDTFPALGLVPSTARRLALCIPEARQTPPAFTAAENH
jgi:hypothetical protein